VINIVVPMAGNSEFFDNSNYSFSKPLVEINGKTMIEHFIENMSQINTVVKFIFIISNEDSSRYHIDDALSLLTNQKCEIIKIDGKTKGAACSALMAIKYINNNSPLVIVNYDQVIFADLNKVIKVLSKCDAGVITFESIHPKWSYVKLNDGKHVSEVAEKKPLSKNAIAGFYFYTKGFDFIESAKSMIKKDVRVNESFFVSLTFNELILMNKKIATFPIDSNNYHSFYSPRKIEEYERITK